jgi:hypothetical protein
MIVPKHEIELKKRVGKLKGQDVWYVKSKGGLHLVSKGSGEVIGAASHRAIARHIAEKSEPDIEWTELSKSDHYAPSDFEHLIPTYEELTKRIRQLQGY